MLELGSLRRRVNRQRTLGRISAPDHKWLNERIDEIESRIIRMSEINEEGEEEG
jgi:hypothetical protein